MRVLIAGANGQVGWELQQSAPADYEVIALGSAELDITSEDAVSASLHKHKPNLVINAAAYTAVDKAEEEREQAYAVNAYGAGYIADACRELGSRLIHISTDFVFDGKQSTPYLPSDATHPLGVYGASKLEGERLVEEKLSGRALTIRTAWVYSQHGNNFVKTMLRLMAQREQLGIVSDQIGTPTHAASLARAIWVASGKDVSGIYHWTDAGVASWYDFAIAIYEEARLQGLLYKELEIKPIRTVDYPTPAERPKYSVLDKSSAWADISDSAKHWRHELREMLNGYKECN